MTKMKNGFVASLIAVIVAVLPAAAQKHHGENSDLPERDEIRQTYELSSGARVDVSGINGTVEIETANTDTAEVHIVRSAYNREDLNYHKINVTHSATSLVVRGEQNRNREARDRKVRHRVLLKLPRRVELSVSGVNGWTTVGEIDGSVNLSGINGKVDVAQAMGHSDISGINGSVTIKIAQLGERGLEVSGINGGVNLTFTEDINADLDVSGINGSVNTDMPNVTITGKVSRQNFRARIGSGGARINVSGINGGVKITRAGAAG